MKCFEQILFLKALPGIGDATIMKKYFPYLNENTEIKKLQDIILKDNPSLSDNFQEAENKAKDAFHEVEQAKDFDVLTYFDEQFPKSIKNCNCNALFLYVKGNTEILNKDSIAIIGTREPSDWTSKTEYALTNRIIKDYDRVIVSGLAIGCDSIAHKCCVDNNYPTIAVLPSGFNYIAPKINEKLSQKIIDTGGCLISQYSPNTKAEKYYYNARDVIVAALSNKLIIAECEKHSGTIYTAEQGFKFNKPLGCITAYGKNNPYTGNEYLIKELNAFSIADNDALKSFMTKNKAVQSSIFD